MASRRPSTANDAPSRMPFSAAEALLWGPEMKKQHAYLLTEMRALQKQHEGYDARIRATEAVAEAAETATSQVRHLEQQLAVIQAERDDKAFEKWASPEITRLGTLVDTNENLRQKQTELDTKVSHISESLNRFLRNSLGFEDALRRLDLLEHDRREDARRIQSLEREVNRLRSIQESGASCSVHSRTGLESGRDIRKDLMLPKDLNVETPHAMAGTDNEVLLPWMSPREEIHVPQSPGMQEASSGNTAVTPPTQGRSITSARWRLLQRPSIHDSKLPRPMEEQNIQPIPAEIPCPDLGNTSPPPTQLVSRKRQHNEPVPVPVPALQHQVHENPKAKDATSKAPATQLVDRKPPRKRKQPVSRPLTQRQTRSQVRKNQAKDTQPEATTGTSAVPETQPVQKTEPVSPPRKKLKATPAGQRAGNKVKSSGTSQAASRNTRKTQDQYKIEEPSANEPLPSAKSASTSTRLRKKATASRKKKPTSVLPSAVSSGPSVQKQLIVKLLLDQRAQAYINVLQG